MTPDVTSVRPLKNHELWVLFDDGEQRHFSMKPYLCYPAFQPLNEQTRFTAAYVCNGTVAWPGDIDISPDTLYLAGKQFNPSK